MQDLDISNYLKQKKPKMSYGATAIGGASGYSASLAPTGYSANTAPTGGYGANAGSAVNDVGAVLSSQLGSLVQDLPLAAAEVGAASVASRQRFNKNLWNVMFMIALGTLLRNAGVVGTTSH